MTALDLDFAGLDTAPQAEAVEAEDDRDPVRAAWLRRRDAGIGASEIAVVMVALGMRSSDVLASYQLPDAHPIKVRLNKRQKAVAIPRVFLRKAGLRRPTAMTDVQRLGIEREPELVRQWRLRLERGTAGPDCELIDAATVKYLPELDLPEIFPLRDSVEPRLTCTPDITARNVFGSLGCVDGKCSYEAYGPKYGAAPERTVIQVNAQTAVCNGTWGACLEGEYWSASHRDRDGKPWGPVVTWPIEISRTLQDECREAARLGWQKVEEIVAEVNR